MRIAISFLMLLVLCQFCLAATIHVPSEQPTIQAGINAAVDGDTVLVADGIYQGDGNRDVLISSKNIVLKSENGSGNTFIDCQANISNRHIAFYFENIVTTGSLIEGFTIINGNSDADYLAGGAIRVFGASIRIESCVFNNNISKYGGAIYANGNWTPCQIIIEYCVFQDNSSSETGGAIFQQGVGESMIIRNCTFYSNSADNGSSLQCNGSCVIENTIITYGTQGYAIEGIPSFSCCNIYGNSDGDWTPNIVDQMGVNGNISADPLFCDTATYNLHIDRASPCHPDSTGCELMGALGVGCGHIPRLWNVFADSTGDAPTIQAAIDSSYNSDTVLVHDGHYFERISYNGKSIIVASEYLLDNDTMHIINAIIDGDTSISPMTSDTGSVVRFVNGEDSSTALVGLTIQNGIGIPRPFIVPSGLHSAGGGIFGDFATAPKLEYCNIINNSADIGGGIWSNGSALISNCVIQNNYSPIGDLEGCAGIAGVDYTAENCEISNNIGGGVLAIYAANLMHCNVSTNNGYGVWGHNYFYKSDVRNKDGYGLKLNDCSIIQNQGRGIGVWEYIQLTVENCVIAGNLGGLSFANNGAGYQFAMKNSEISNNSAFQGGGIYYNSLTYGHIINCIFYNNIASYGGAIYSGSTKNHGRDSAIFINCTFVDNISENGAVMYTPLYNNWSVPSFEKCVLAFNKIGQAIVCADDNISVLVCCNVFGNEGGDWVGCIADQYGVNDNISADPLFCNAINHDYHIAAISQCAPENSSCNQLIGALGVGCDIAIMAFSILEESSLQNIINHQPTFSWAFAMTRDFVQTHFEIAVGIDTNWQYAEMWNPAPFESSDTSVAYAGATLIDGQTYYARLRIGDEEAWTDWYKISFRMNSVPTIPALIKPINDSFTGLMPVLWLSNSMDAEDDPLLYLFQISNDSTFKSPLANSPNIIAQDDSTSWQCDIELTENDRYWWRARSTDTFEESNWSNPESFYVNAVNTAPSEFALYMPPDTSGLPIITLQPTFIWSPSSDPDPLDFVLYTLVIALDANFIFSSQIPDIVSSEYTLQTELEWGHRYWWKVRAEDQYGGLTWSSNIKNFWTMTCGDANNDKNVNISDAVYVINFVFIGGNPPIPYESGDANCDGAVNISDAVWIINYVFIGGNEPCDLDGNGISDC